MLFDFFFVKVMESPRDAPFFIRLQRRRLLLSLPLFGMWIYKLHFHQLSKAEPSEMGNEIKMRLDTLIDFNCSCRWRQSHWTSHRRCNDNKNNGNPTHPLLVMQHDVCRPGEWRPDAGSIATYRCGRLDQNTIWLFNLCVSLVSPFIDQASAFYRRAINNVTLYILLSGTKKSNVESGNELNERSKWSGQFIG